VILDDEKLDPNEIYKETENDEQCQLSGHIDIYKVPGNIHISNHGYKAQWESLKQKEPEFFPRLRLSHKTKIFNFGSPVDIHHIVRRFGISDHTEFNRHTHLPKFMNNQKMNYDYFLKIIPYIFIDEERDNETTQGYQYSLNFRERPFIEKPKAQHILKINYDFSPISMRITRKKKFISHFIGNVCAIVGGIFVIFGLINKFFFACCSDEKKQV